PTRWPVNVPGPVVTARRSRSENANPDSRIVSSTMRAKRSAWPRSMISKRCARMRASSTTAQEHAPNAVSTASSFMRVSSENLARLVECETRRTREDARRIAIAEAADEIGFDVGACEEFLVHAGIVEAGHWTAIEPHCARGDDEVTALQGAVAEGRDL